MYKKYTSEQRIAAFWSKVDKSGGPNACWLWTAFLPKPSGYGRVKWDGIQIPSHRVSWMLANGDIPKGMLVCHHCDNPPCVNPAHLFLGDYVDNALDMVKKGRNPDRHGENCGNAKLTWAQVSEIKALYKPNVMGFQRLADMYGVGRTTIFHVIHGDTWK